MEDIAGPLYNVLDWSRSAIGGSYALQQFTRAQWTPADIDIAYKCSTHDEFVREVQRVREATDARIDKMTLLTEEMRNSPEWSGRDERYHESIIASATLTVPAIPSKVQLVGMDPQKHFLGETDILGHLNRITDLPACVSYTVRGHERIFQVPERCIDALRTHRVQRWQTCKTRREKYEARGYVYEDE
jgi:hypothetical protein